VMLPLIIGLVLGGFTLIQEWLAWNGSAWSLEHLSLFWSAFAGFEASFAGGLVTPALTLLGLIFVALGIIRVGTSAMSARSYLVLSFLLTALLLAIWQPTLMYLLFVPLALLTTIGIEALVREWYDLFPRNPYARLLPIAPLTVLIVGLGWTSIMRYNLSQNYDANVVYNYSQEFSAVRSILDKEKNVTIVVSPDQKKFYEILQNDFPEMSIATELRKDTKNIVLGSASVENSDIPSKIVTDSRAKNSVLLRVY